jgi:hypothetical protein
LPAAFHVKQNSFLRNVAEVARCQVIKKKKSKKMITLIIMVASCLPCETEVNSKDKNPSRKYQPAGSHEETHLCHREISFFESDG